MSDENHQICQHCGGHHSINFCTYPVTESSFAAAGGSGASVRQLHLINAIRVWMNRAITHAENGNCEQAESAIRSAREILATLERLCL